LSLEIIVGGTRFGCGLICFGGDDDVGFGTAAGDSFGRNVGINYAGIDIAPLAGGGSLLS